MRARVSFISALLVIALSGCGDDKSGSDKQSKISAAAYPAVDEFVTTDVKVDRYGPICDKLSTVSQQDEVAAAAERACTKVVALASELKLVKPQVATCGGEPDCVADKAGRALTQYLEGLREFAVTFNRELKNALEPGACLKTLTLPEADLKAIDTALERLPAAIERLRGGDRTGLDALDDIDFSGERDPKPCKA